MKRLLIVYHSRTGGTEQMVKAAADGAATVSNVAIEVLRASEAAPDAVLAVDGEWRSLLQEVEALRARQKAAN